jgi:ATP adenylyltransferase/5',5'''-P-1,P-4-tetraphosphate phosphorylase II
MDFSKKARELIKEQILHWDLASKNYQSLKKVRVKTFNFENFHIDIQFNPEGIVSSSAKVDLKSIEERPCFLCQKNLPAEQRWLTFKKDYIVLVNPFPIFAEHLTIANISHTDQRIKGNFENMLDLAEALEDFVVFYNGPKCGASAPDHLHFQAGIKGFLPIEADFSNDRCCQRVRIIDNVTISHWLDYGRGIITLNSKDKENLIQCFDQIYGELEILQTGELEPMLNILASFEKGEWIIHIFPRMLHRPSQYFLTTDKQLILSPASVDMGGVFITPREQDYNRISEKDITDIFRQVCMSPSAVLKSINQL